MAFAVATAWRVVGEASLLCSAGNPMPPRTAELHLYVHLLVLQQTFWGGLHRASLWACVAQPTASVLRHNHTNSLVSLSLPLFYSTNLSWPPLPASSYQQDHCHLGRLQTLFTFRKDSTVSLFSRGHSPALSGETPSESIASSVLSRVLVVYVKKVIQYQSFHLPEAEGYK